MLITCEQHDAIERMLDEAREAALGKPCNIQARATPCLVATGPPDDPTAFGVIDGAGVVIFVDPDNHDPCYGVPQAFLLTPDGQWLVEADDGSGGYVDCELWWLDSIAGPCLCVSVGDRGALA